uniref:VP2 n=2 Tax=Human polyomavirus 6 TaxID=746830 RepID=D6QWH3_9POLY|nr:VP2 [Human polyomavirus 6]
MGILFSLPEIIAAAAVGGGEALEIAGGLGALVSGEGLATLEALQSAAALSSEATAALAVSNEAAIVLSTVPELSQTLFGAQLLLSSVAGVGGVIYSNYNPGELYKAPEGPGGLGPRVGNTTMALQLWLPQVWSWGGAGRGLPDWLINMLREVPSPTEILSDIVRGIWTSYYRAGREIIQRTASRELGALLSRVRETVIHGAERALEAAPDPVQGLVNLVNYAVNYNRQWETRALLEGRPLFEGNGVVNYDMQNLPVNGNNDQRGGFHDEGLWVSFSAEQGNTSQYCIPQWLLFVLEELDKEIKEDALSQKRKWTNSKASQSNKKRRSGGYGNSATF